ncbi:uncharacterized protein LOC106640388 [Copidosoma floridanum]|uniref:uncharacterized protein LOC106640388 n=1 Tax=Copidosoma floridanum TaxID=29053 RepID=UPI0006C97591|nr:uncharacterized protein LOC106640388 [Copidosoma floridanum]
MALLARVTITIALLHSMTPTVKPRGIDTYHEEWTFQKKEIILSRDLSTRESNSAGENSFLYALCEDGHWKPTKTCNVVVEHYTPEHITYRSTCRLNLATGKESRMIGRNFILTHLGNTNRALFAWLDRERTNWAAHEVYLCVRVVDWSSCKSTDVKIPIDPQNDLVDEIVFNNVLARDDTFEVFFNGKELCRTGRCKMTFNADGQRIGQPESFLPKEELTTPLSMVLPVSNSTAFKGYFVIEWTSKTLAVKLVGADGSAKEATRVLLEGYTNFGVSSGFEVFGVCWLPMHGDATVKCAQIDSGGEVILNVTLNFGYRVMLVRMHNLVGGGFLLLQLGCTDDFCVGYKTFFVSRIRGNGRHDNRPLEISGIDLDVSVLDRYRVNLFERAGDELCVSFAGPATLSEFDIIQQKPRMTYVSKCFDKKYVIG